jgi:hypothetical protein
VDAYEGGLLPPRFATLQAVVEHYDRVLGPNLSAQQRNLIEYLKSL